MSEFPGSALAALLEKVVGSARARRLFETLEVEPLLLSAKDASRAIIAQSLHMLLFEDLMRRVSPDARAYVRDRVRRGEKLEIDHGAVRTIAAPSGELPAGEAAITRFLLPLGFRLAGVYPVEVLRMTGRAYTHSDFPETIAQFFVSEVHTERFSPAAQATIRRIIASSKDPLPSGAKALLEELGSAGGLPLEKAAWLLPNLVACFDRHHDEPSLGDYESLRGESPEMAWFATEGSVFNHSTDRVADVTEVAANQKRVGRAMKEGVEISASGRVLQTAFRSAMVERLFEDGDGNLVSRCVPGSFLEVITRHEESPGKLDLTFDVSNAQKLIETHGTLSGS